MANPLLFISHKHDDSGIARVVGNFVRGITGGGVDVYLSSDPSFVGPRVGKELGTELKDALWRASVVILIYTTDDRDWSWCMWECGLAEDAKSADTKVVVLQCLKDKPNVFEGRVRTMAWEEESLVTFANLFLEEDFFPGGGKPMTGLDKQEIKERVPQFFKDLNKAIPQTPVENWAAWPFIRLQLPRKAIEAVQASAADARVAAAREALLANCSIVAWSSGSPGLFGNTELACDSPFQGLLDDWREKYPKRPQGWVDVIAKQIADGSRKKMPEAERRERFRPVAGDGEYVACVGRVKSLPAVFQFDVYFVGVAQVPLAETRMNRLENMYYLDLEVGAANETLTSLLDELAKKGWNRIPVLANAKARYIVHCSMIDRFIRQKAYDGEEVADLTLADLLKEDELEKMFASTFAVVSESATIADVQQQMLEIPNCVDAFVTPTADRNEDVLGWITDRDIIAALS